MSSTRVPFTSIPLGKTTFQVTTSVGKCLQTYDLARGLHLLFVSRPQTPQTITATAAWKDRVFAAWGPTGSKPSGVWVFKRGKKVDELEQPPGPLEPIKQLLIFGSWIVGGCDNQIQIWNSTTYEHFTTLVPAGPRHGKTKRVHSGVICNMPTYLNKIFVGRQDGSVEIWNVSTGYVVPLQPASRSLMLCQQAVIYGTATFIRSRRGFRSSTHSCFINSGDCLRGGAYSRA